MTPRADKHHREENISQNGINFGVCIEFSSTYPLDGVYPWTSKVALWDLCDSDSSQYKIEAHIYSSTMEFHKNISAPTNETEVATQYLRDIYIPILELNLNIMQRKIDKPSKSNFLLV